MPNLDIQRIKALAHPVRTDIIRVLGKEKQPAPIKRVAEILGQKPTKLHYHFKLLEAAGYIEVADTREINGITERFYHLTGEDHDIILSYRENPEAVTEVIPLLEHKTLEVIRRIPTLDREKDAVLIGQVKEFFLRPDQAYLAKRALQDFLEHKVAQLPEDVDEETGDPYDLVVFLVPRQKDDT